MNLMCEQNKGVLYWYWAGSLKPHVAQCVPIPSRSNEAEPWKPCLWHWQLGSPCSLSVLWIKSAQIDQDNLKKKTHSSPGTSSWERPLILDEWLLVMTFYYKPFTTPTHPKMPSASGSWIFCQTKPRLPNSIYYIKGGVFWTSKPIY